MKGCTTIKFKTSGNPSTHSDLVSSQSLRWYL